MNFYITLLNLTKLFKGSLGQYMRKAARPSGGMDSSNHAAGGASGSITMVVVFVGCLYCFGWTRDVTSSSYVKNGTKITLRLG
jgi:hypothetical protein